ncbi:MAG: fibronectin type III domain-containing protein [Candidatus Marinimicrobia bacterium]|nr:fibronectin type III domain-containing protein [Candidatus Neomarinimicrobiota bacterium]
MGHSRHSIHWFLRWGLTLLLFMGGVTLWQCSEPPAEDVTPPVPVIINPASDLNTAVNVYTLRARVTDNQKVAGVAFMQGTDTLGRGIQEENTSYYYYRWNTHSFANLDTVENIYVEAVDAAGNQASSETRRVVVDNRGVAPHPVEITNVSAPVTGGSIDKYQLNITWTPTNAYYFDTYLLYRSEDEQVDSLDTLIDSITIRSQSAYADTHAMGIQKSFSYCIYVVVDSIWSAKSNIKSGTTGDWVEIELDQVTPVGKHTMQVHWNRTLDPYFKSYRVYRSRFAAIDTTRDTLVFYSEDHNRNEFTDGGLHQNTNYTYQVWVTDTHGAIFKTDPVSARTLALQPAEFVGATNVTKYSATIQWEPSSDAEFSGYRLTRSADSLFMAEHDTLLVTNDVSRTAYSDLFLNGDRDYFYYLWVLDPDTLVTGPPLVVHTRSVTPVILNSLVPGRYQFEMSWSQYLPVRSDFRAYVVTKTVNDTLTPVDTIRNLTTLTYTDTKDIAYGVNHTYKIAVLDTNGGVGFSNGIMAEPLRIHRANVVNIQPSGQDGLILQWDWADQPESDFAAFQINRYTDLFILQNGDTTWIGDELLEEVPAALLWKSSQIVTTITNVAQRSYTDNAIQQSEGDYAYQIMVKDSRGNLEGGEILGNFVAMTLPSVTLLAPANITNHSATLLWTPAQAASAYELFYNTDSTGMSRDNSELVAETVNLQANVTGLGSGVTYWFAVWARDSRGNYSERSNLVKVETLF